MWNSIWFNEEQLHWIEDLPKCYVKVISLPEGESFGPQASREPIRVGHIPSFTAANERMNIWRSWDVFTGHKDDLKSISRPKTYRIYLQFSATSTGPSGLS
jgi:hypothetical protein